jgi:hypothetical protein
MKKKITRNQVIICCIVAIAVLAIAAIAATVLSKPRSETAVVVRVTTPPSDIDGGVTKYSVTGANSAQEANFAIIKQIYTATEYHRAITDDETRNIVSKLAASGCGQITGEFVGAPPEGIDAATFWTNVICEDRNVDPIIYIQDDQYYIYF